MESRANDPEVMASRTNDPEVMESRTNDPEVMESRTNDPEVMASRTNDPEMMASRTNDPEMMESRTNDPEIMRVLGLVSGGKDSCYNLIECQEAGHELVALATLVPSKDQHELDSPMFQTIDVQWVRLWKQCTNLPFYQKQLKGRPLSGGLSYNPQSGDEVEDLYDLIAEVQEKQLIQAVAVGAILSNYQRIRVESVCQRLGLTPLSYLWERDGTELLGKMRDCGIEAIIVKVASMGLSADLLGRSVWDCLPLLQRLESEIGSHVCGEGGEYETMVLDCPLFKTGRLEVLSSRRMLQTDGTAHLVVEECHVVDKTPPTPPPLPTLLPMYEWEDLPDIAPEEISTSSVQSQLEISVVTSPGDSWLNRHDPVPMFPNHFRLNSSSGAFQFQVPVAADTPDALDIAFKSVKSSLESAGGQIDDILSVQLILNGSMALYQRINQEYIGFFKAHRVEGYPVRTAVAVDLPENWAALLSGRGLINSQEKKTVHVQSVSHWAPVSIGPYSQGIRKGMTGSTSGQIGLIPGTMDLVSPDPVVQGKLSLRHIRRVLDVLYRNFGSSDDVNVVSQKSFHILGFLHDLSSAEELKRLIWTLKEQSGKILPQEIQHVVDFVQVAGLPRDAAVEWQIKVHADDSVNFQRISFSTLKSLKKWAAMFRGRTAALLQFPEYREEGRILLQLATVQHWIRLSVSPTPPELCLSFLHSSSLRAVLRLGDPGNLTPPRYLLQRPMEIAFCWWLLQKLLKPEVIRATSDHAGLMFHRRMRVEVAEQLRAAAYVELLFLKSPAGGAVLGQDLPREPAPYFQCPEDDPNGAFAHESFCDKFYDCVAGEAALYVIKDCSNGLHFDPITGQCTWPAIAKRQGCEQRKQKAPDGWECPDIESESRDPALGPLDPNPTYPHPTDCAKFYICIGGTDPRPNACPFGLVFDIGSGKCVPAANVPECADWYDDADTSTAAPQIAKVVKKVRPAPPKVEAVEKVDDFTCPPDLRLEDTNGNPHPTFPHPTDCSKFYVCIDFTEPRLNTCSAQLVYNIQKETCDEASNVPDCADWYSR
ncbi:unnamed protein product [Cyprideis torosa]|uniref:Diphthine--ammonia ligase n=1 Tax=Cyprideis torosa TaxID=163714 RepID=A0A7R8W1Y2_9CRUS|nr:unnamed protein product [Cyprideis torosa]CAG0880327.1 unnamed protein product [Cyprideis torosa]